MRRKLWSFLVRLYPAFLRKVYGMHIGNNCVISWSAHLDKSINPKGIHIGDNVWILRGAMILAHDHCRKLKTDVKIGNNSVIGINSVVMPGVVIGSNVVVGACAVVTKGVPSGSIVVGNPAKVIKSNIIVNDKGQIVE